MEELNKTQIILLTLLVSFVTSIATGIVTVTLMDQAPPAITHTISKVVEHTIEKVVPDKTQTATTVKTVIVKESDLIAEAIGKTEKNLVRIYTEENGAPKFVAIGYVISSKGIVVTDSGEIANGVTYTLRSGESFFSGKVVGQDETRGIGALLVDSKDPLPFSDPTYSNAGDVKLGQTLISLSGEDDTTVSTGAVSNLVKGQTVATTTAVVAATGTIAGKPIVEYLYAIKANMTPAPSTGSPVFDVDGDLIGISIMRNGVLSIVPETILRATVSSFAIK